jgi:PIN domain nuclease of toxin-antitoxin system
MRLLLDTHAFIWWDREPGKLSERVYASCQDERNTLCLSAASIWEMQIKLGIGKLHFGRSLEQVVEDQVANGLEILPIKLSHLWMLAELPRIHGDPFDRLLVAQSIAEDIPLVSADRVFSEYPVKLFW